MTAHVSPGLQEKLLQLILAISEGRSDEAATLAIAMGEKREDFDEAQLRKRIAAMVAENTNATVEQIQIGKVMMRITRMSGECNIRVPSELTMLGKTLLNLDEIGRTLDPEFDPNAAVRRDAARILRQKLTRSVSPGSLFSSLIDVKEFVQTLPRRVNKILDHVADNDLAVRVDAFDEEKLMSGLQKIANRICVGLILAALIVGASMLMRVPTSWTLLGYPGLAILFFFGAAGGGLVLMFNILLHDVRSRK